ATHTRFRGFRGRRANKLLMKPISFVCFRGAALQITPGALQCRRQKNENPFNSPCDGPGLPGEPYPVVLADVSGENVGSRLCPHGIAYSLRHTNAAVP